MSPLEPLQQSILKALNLGPDHFNPVHFTGTNNRSILGLKVHANTISHARLVALEETFPLLRETINHAPFNEVSRQYIEWDGVRGLSLTHIGERFAPFLVETHQDRSWAELAEFEWAWLTAYHAADAPAASLADITGLDPYSLLEWMIERHPAAQAVHFVQGPSSVIIRSADGLEDTKWILLARPEAEVLLSPLSTAAHMALTCLTESMRLCNLFQAIAEQGFEEEAMDAVLALIRGGAIKQIKGDRV